MERVLAIDGALNKSGWVILEDSGKKIKAKQYGIIKPKATMPLGFKLFYIRSEVISLFKKYKPNMIVFEDTYAGKNAKTNARLNNAKGVFYVTAYELLNKQDPVYVGSAEARKCLGVKNNKPDVYEYFKKIYKIDEPFEKANDITDAMAVGYCYIFGNRGECAKETKKKAKAKAKAKAKTKVTRKKEL